MSIHDSRDSAAPVRPSLAAERGSWRDLRPAAALLVATLVVMTILTFRPAPGAAQLVAVFPPWVSLDQAIGRIGAAGGVAVRTGALDSILLAQSDAPDFAKALRRAGAWLVADPIVLGGCFSLTTTGADRRPASPSSRT